MPGLLLLVRLMPPRGPLITTLLELGKQRTHLSNDGALAISGQATLSLSVDAAENVSPSY
jgi:hypothetical protein